MWVIHTEKMKMDSYLTPTHKNQSLLGKELSTKKEKQSNLLKDFIKKYIYITLGYERVFYTRQQKNASHKRKY